MRTAEDVKKSRTIYAYEIEKISPRGSVNVKRGTVRAWTDEEAAEKVARMSHCKIAGFDEFCKYEHDLAERRENRPLQPVLLKKNILCTGIEMSAAGIGRSFRLSPGRKYHENS